MSLQARTPRVPDLQIFPFLSLPCELRHEIYRFVFCDCPSTPLTIPPNHSLPSLCFVNRFVYNESVLFRIRSSNVVVDDRIKDRREALAYLRRFPANTGFDAVRSLVIPLMCSHASLELDKIDSFIKKSRYPHIFAKMFPRLVNLHLRLSATVLIAIPFATPFVLLEPEALDEATGISKTLELDSLQRLYIAFTDCEMCARFLECRSEDIYGRYVGFLKEKSGEYRGKVAVIVEIV